MLPAGRPDSGSDERLTSERMQRVLAEAAARVRLGDHRHAAGRRCCPTRICSPRWSDGVLLVVRAGKTPLRAGQAGRRRARPRADPRRRAQRRRISPRVTRGGYYGYYGYGYAACAEEQVDHGEGAHAGRARGARSR